MNKPTSKERKEAIRKIEMGILRQINLNEFEEEIQTLLSIAKQQEVGSEEIEEIINKHEEWLWTDDGTKRIDITKHNKILANSLKDKFIITRR